MIFLPEHCELIKQELKTHTRRILKNHEHFTSNGEGPIDEVCYLASNGKYRVRWKVGRTYAVCPGRGKSSIARIKLNRIKFENIKSISNEDIIAEGIIHTRWLRGTFAMLWDRIHRKPNDQWDNNPLVWVLAFELAK